MDESWEPTADMMYDDFSTTDAALIELATVAAQCQSALNISDTSISICMTSPPTADATTFVERSDGQSLFDTSSTSSIMASSSSNTTLTSPTYDQQTPHLAFKRPIPPRDFNVYTNPLSKIKKRTVRIVDSTTVYHESGEMVDPAILGKREGGRHDADAEQDQVASKKRGPRCETYESVLHKRNRCRIRHLTGILKKVRDLNITTKDNVKVEFYNSDVATVTRYASTMELFKKGTSASNDEEEDEEELPGASELNAYSPAKVSKTSKKKIYKCQWCPIVDGTPESEAYNSGWLGCDTKGCDNWSHIKCLGLTLNREIKSMGWNCFIHRERPPMPRSIATTTKAKKPTKPRKQRK